LKKNTSDQQCSVVCMILDCVGITQSSVIRIVHPSVDVKHFFIYLNLCYYH